MSDDLSFDDFPLAMRHLLDQVAWTFYPDAGPDPDAPTVPYATHAGILHTPIRKAFLGIPPFQGGRERKVDAAASIFSEDSVGLRLQLWLHFS